MKRLLMALIVGLVSMGGLSAQDGLRIARFFSDSFLSRPDVTSVNITGDRLKQWKCNISKYRSISMKDNPEEVAAIERAVKADGSQAEYRTVSMNDGHIAFGFYCLPPIRKDDDGKNEEPLNRLIIFLNGQRGTSNTRKMDLIYIEGRATLEEFKQMLRSMKN